MVIYFAISTWFFETLPPSKLSSQIKLVWYGMVWQVICNVATNSCSMCVPTVLVYFVNCSTIFFSLVCCFVFSWVTKFCVAIWLSSLICGLFLAAQCLCLWWAEQYEPSGMAAKRKISQRHGALFASMQKPVFLITSKLIKAFHGQVNVE